MVGSFWFWTVVGLLTFVLDALWWAVAMRLTKNKLWRALVSLFMAFLIVIHFSLMADFDWPLEGPRFVLVSAAIWFRMGLPFALGLLLLAAVLQLRSRSGRRSPQAAPAVNDQAMARREFIGTCAAAAPCLFTIGSTGAAMAQLNQFRVRRFTLGIPRLPRALDGLTIAHVSDMHVGRFTSQRVLRRMVDATNALRADLVLLTGDLIHYELADLPEAIELVKGMQGRFGQWMIEGNHDVAVDGGEFGLRVKAAGVPLLLDESSMATVRGHPVQFFGLRWMQNTKGRSHESDERITSMQLRTLLKRRQPDAFPVLLAHHPHVFDEAARAGLPLTLAGHTHGGQWMLNHRFGVGPVLFRYWSGLYARAGSQMIVSNGVGNVFPLRLNAPAEIVHITLRIA